MVVPSQKVDVVVVLTGGVGRIKRGVELLLEGKGENLFISGIAEDVSLEDILLANGMEPLPEIFHSRIILGRLSRSTPENAKEIRSILERHDFDSVLLVTSQYHLARASQLIERELERWPERKIEIYFDAVESPNFDPHSWWTSLTGWQIFLSEYLKSFAIRFSVDSVF